ncbi:MAG: SRPBCC family protein [Desulfobacterales bacterium]|nr:SRPBCC family protein [Desulfobacterales bacterium]
MALTKVEVMIQVGGTGFSSTGFQPVKHIQAVRQQAYAIMKDVERYPEYMASVKSIEVLERNQDMLITRWDADIEGAPVNWVQNVWMKDESQEMTFEATEGDFDVFRGKWSVSQSGTEVWLKLIVEYKLGIPVIEEVLGPVLEEKVKANSEAMLEAIVSQL